VSRQPEKLPPEQWGLKWQRKQGRHGWVRPPEYARTHGSFSGGAAQHKRRPPDDPDAGHLWRRHWHIQRKGTQPSLTAAVTEQLHGKVKY